MKKVKSITTAALYKNVLLNIKESIHNAQVRSALAANAELIKLYWDIGKTIAIQQREHGWGNNVIESIAEDLQKAFPGVSGFSRRNLFRIQAFFLAYEKVPQAVAQISALPIFGIPWGHNAVILEKVKKTEERLWYAQKSIEYGWSRTMLEMWIKNTLYKREGKAITNFAKTLPAPQSDIAQQSLKDPYVFDFLELQEDYRERELEQGLIDNIQKLLLELGKGFAFVARQYHLSVADNDYYIDLLFYHYKLRCFVVVELKTGDFDPRDAGQLNFYLSVVDDQLKNPDDNPTIGMLLCRTKNNIVAEYALRDIHKPIGVAGYEEQIFKKLPKNFKSTLPTIEEIESELKRQEEQTATNKKRPMRKKRSGQPT